MFRFIKKPYLITFLFFMSACSSSKFQSYLKGATLYGRDGDNCSCHNSPKLPVDHSVKTGADRIVEFLPDLKGKTVALVVNHTSTIKRTHLADSLLSLGVKIKTIFAPEHGFRGTADAGEHVSNGIDRKTGLPIVSLYGSNKKPNPGQLEGIDIVIFDIQDVGTRFYTYTSTMHYVMEACAENNKTLMILDRPNPNGHYVDGPVLQKKFSSFVGLNPVPIVHGCTVAELALMINGEKWLKDGNECKLKIITCLNYKHSMPYAPPVAPSPNLPNLQSILLYPSICLFEGTVVSVGRGTDTQFQVIGSPNPENGTYTFTPVEKPGAKNPPLKDTLCYGLDLRTVNARKEKFTLKYVLDFYQKSTQKDKFINRPKSFDLLAGSDSLRKLIQSGYSEKDIRKTWQTDLDKYKNIRKKYLLYAE